MTGNEDEQAMAAGAGPRRHEAEVPALPIPDRMRILLDDRAAGSDTEVQS
jgi:hypothetical protein